MAKGKHDPFPIIEGRYGKIGRADDKTAWVEGTYGDRAWSASAGDDAAPSRAGFIGLAATSGRVALVFLIFAAVYFLIIGRMFLLSFQAGHFRLLSENNSTRILRTPSPRGVIFDANGVQLVENVPDLKLAVIPALLPKDEAEKKSALAEIGAVIGLSADEIGREISDSEGKDYEPVAVGLTLTHDQAVDLTVKKTAYPFLDIVTGTHRRYTQSDTLLSLSHLLGYTGKVGQKDLSDAKTDYTPTDFVGKAGLENYYEGELKGRPRAETVQVDAMGREKKILGVSESVPGLNLKLNIDADLTTVAENTLRSVLAADHLKSGVVIAMDPRDGALKALVSLPAYSDNLFATGISADEYKKLSDDPAHPLFPRATAGTYPSGSTVKMVLAAGALNEGTITPHTTVNSTGGILYANRWWFPDWKAGGHGITDLKNAIAWSVNTFFYALGGGYENITGLGMDRIDKYYALFGIGKKLGLDLPNEADGFLPTPEWKLKERGEEWFIGDTYHVSIGQGDLLVTPLQVASWTAAVANGGTLWKPRLAQAFVDDVGETVKTVPSEAIRTGIVPDKYLSAIRDGMRATVTFGSGRALNVLPIAVAGKTGTAQWASNKANHAWFTGFAPYEDPQIVVTVLLEEGGEGSSTAVPVARDILAWWAKNRLKQSTPNP